MTVTIKIIGGKTITLYVDATDSIDNIKARIEESEGIPADRQRLIYAGKEIVNGRTLPDYNFQPEGTLHLIIRD